MVQAIIDQINSWNLALQSGISDIFLSRKSMTYKMELVNIELLNFKIQILNMLKKIIKKQQPYKIVFQNQKIESFDNQIQSNKDKMFKMKLHLLLKNKLRKARKQTLSQSSISSKQSQHNFNSGIIDKLNTSIHLLEDDLKIESQQNQHDENSFLVSQVIQKSRMSLQQSTNFLHNFDSASSVLNLSRNSQNNDNFNINEYGSVKIQLQNQSISKPNILSKTINNQQSVEIKPKKTKQSQTYKDKQKSQASVSHNMTKFNKKAQQAKRKNIKQSILGNLLQQNYHVLEQGNN